MDETHSPVLVRMPVEQKNALQAEAKKHARTLTGEINERLRISLGARGPTLQGILAREAGLAPAKHLASVPSTYTEGHQPTVIHATTNDNGPAPALTDVDRAMLEVLHKLPVEKQLALLSLFR